MVSKLRVVNFFDFIKKILEPGKQEKITESRKIISEKAYNQDYKKDLEDIKNQTVARDINKKKDRHL